MNARWIVSLAFISSLPLSLIVTTGRAEDRPASASDAPLPLPPREHPRSYLRQAHVDQLAARLQDPVLQPVVARLEKMAATSSPSRVEWAALHYLAAPDATRGRAIVAETLELLQKSELPQRQDGCRVTGRM